MATARAILQAHVDDLFTESVQISAQWTFTSGIYETHVVDLSSGNNTITVPAGARFILLEPPAANSQTLNLRGNTGDTGTTIGPNRPHVHSYQSGSFIINAGGTVTGVRLTFLG